MADTLVQVMPDSRITIKIERMGCCMVVVPTPYTAQVHLDTGSTTDSVDSVDSGATDSVDSHGNDLYPRRFRCGASHE